MIFSYFILLFVVIGLIRDVPELRKMAANRSQRIWLVSGCGALLLAGVAAGTAMPPTAHNPTGKLIVTGVLVGCFMLILLGAWLSRAASQRLSRAGVYLMLAASAFWAGCETGRYVAS